MTPVQFKAFLEEHESLCLDSEEDRQTLLDAYTQKVGPPTIILEDLEATCYGCPQSWEAKTPDGDEFYAKYRGGKWFMVLTDRNTGEHTTLAEGSTDDEWGGVCKWEEILDWASDQVTIAVRSEKEQVFLDDSDYDTDGLLSALEETGGDSNGR